MDANCRHDFDRIQTVQPGTYRGCLPRAAVARMGAVPGRCDCRILRLPHVSTARKADQPSRGRGNAALTSLEGALRTAPSARHAGHRVTLSPTCSTFLTI